MKPMAAVTLLMLAYIALAGLALWVAYQLVVTGHPVFATLAGCFAAGVALAGTHVELKSK